MNERETIKRERGQDKWWGMGDVNGGGVGEGGNWVWPPETSTGLWTPPCIQGTVEFNSPTRVFWFRCKVIYQISLFLTSVSVLAPTILNYYHNYLTHRLYFGEVENPYGL